MILGAAGAMRPQDFGPNSLHGVSTNGPTMAPNGMVFNGTNQFITIGNVPTLALADNFTICVWIRPGTTGGRTIVSKWNPDISSNEWKFGWWHTDGFRFDTTSGNIEGSRTFTYGRMYFGAVRMLGGTAAIFFNGIADTTGVRSITPGAANVVIGRQDDSSFYVDGTVERVLIYGRPLLHSEIRDLYEAPYSMFVRPNLKRFFIGAATAAAFTWQHLGDGGAVPSRPKIENVSF